MSFLDRVHRAIVSSGRATFAVMGLPFDLGRAPTTDDESDGIALQVFNSIAGRGQAFMQGTLGPESAIGESINLAPKAVRTAASTVTSPVLGALDTAYNEGISQPISTLLTMDNLAFTNGISSYTDPSAWSRAYRIAEHRSPGQALALNLTGTDVTDEAELAKAVATDPYKIISGTTDALSRFYLDPTVLGGKAISAVREAAITRTLRTPEDVLSAMNSPRVAAFNDDITKIKANAARVEQGGKSVSTAAAEIRNRYFPDHEAGAEISTVLAQAESPREQMYALRALMGDKTMIPKLDLARSRVTEEVASLLRESESLSPIKAMEPYRYEGTVIDPASTPTLFGSSATSPDLYERIERYYGKDERLARMQSAFGTLKEAPRSRAVPFIPAIGEIRSNITRSDFYQNSTLGKTLQTFFHMNAHPVVDLHLNTGDIQIDRMLAEAELPQELRDSFRTRYMETNDPNVRHQVAVEAETTAIEHLSKRAGMSTDEVQALLNDLADGRGEAQDMLTKRVYDEKGHSVLHYQNEHGQWEEVAFPPWVTTDHTLLPLVNMRELNSALTRFGEFRSAHPSTNIPPDIANRITRIWKPAVLLRPAWPIRVVGDEQFRIIAKIGALTQFKGLMTGARDYTTDFITARKEVGIGNVAGRSNRVLRQEFGVRPVRINGYDFEGVFGVPGDIRRNVRELASSADSWRSLVGDTESHYLRNFREAGQNFKSVLPDHPDYPAVYNWATEQLAKHPIAKRLLNGESTDDIVTFLHSTPEGADILRTNSIKGWNARNWVEDIERSVADYTAGNTELSSLMASGKATHADLTRLVPDATLHPVAHGEVLNQVLNQGYTAKLIPKLIENIFDKLGRLPTDVMSRNPYMRHMYEAELERQVSLLGDDIPFTNQLKEQIQSRARNYADNETKKLLYDLAESSRFGEMLKFLSPFYNAWQEVITRWAGLAIENPAFIARARLIWNAPDQAGLVTDEEGRPVKPGEIYSDDPAADNYRGKDRLLTIPLPKWVNDIPGMRERSSVSFNKKSFNLVLQGFPSAGVLVQIPVSEVVKNRPELADSVKAILPYGPVDLKQILLPSSAKYVVSAAEEDRRYHNTVIRIYMDKLTDYNLGKRDSAPTFQEAEAEAKAFTYLRAGAAFILPAAPIFHSPYQVYIDAFRQAQARYNKDKTSLADEHGNPRTPDEWFLDTHQKEYFALTQAVTKSLNGVQPTLEAWKKSKEAADIIEQFPEYGGLIIGNDGAGEFNSAVYNAQLATQLAPGSDKTQRISLPLDEAAKDPDRRLGWIEYRRFMDQIEATRIQRGLPNLQVKAASDLANLKSLFTENLKSKYPSWADDFNQTDKGAWEKKIKAFEAISNLPQMKDRSDMQGIREYLKAREGMNALLEQRGSEKNGSKTLNASANEDLKFLWDTITGSLIERNLAFSDVYYRYLENDPLGL